MKSTVRSFVKSTTESEIAALFDRWNRSLQTRDPRRVVANYAERSILLPTVSNKPRLTFEEKVDYFQHFLENGPAGVIDMRQITISGDIAVDSGLYTFTFAKTGQSVSARYSFTYQWNGTAWLILSHHSSGMPESHKPKAQLNKDLGATVNLLQDLIKKADETKALNLTPQQIEHEKTDLLKLQAENQRLKEDIEVLRKASAYFARNQK